MASFSNRAFGVICIETNSGLHIDIYICHLYLILSQRSRSVVRVIDVCEFTPQSVFDFIQH